MPAFCMSSTSQTLSLCLLSRWMCPSLLFCPPEYHKCMWASAHMCTHTNLYTCMHTHIRAHTCTAYWLDLQGFLRLTSVSPASTSLEALGITPLLLIILPSPPSCSKRSPLFPMHLVFPGSFPKSQDWPHHLSVQSLWLPLHRHQSSRRHVSAVLPHQPRSHSCFLLLLLLPCGRSLWKPQLLFYEHTWLSSHCSATKMLFPHLWP